MSIDLKSGSDSLFTVSKKNPDRIELFACRIFNDQYEIEPQVSGRFRLLIVPNGSGTVTLDSAVFPWIGPCILCLNEKQTVSGAVFPGSTRVLYFHPQALNRNLNMENIHQKGQDADQGVIENRLLLRAFISAERIGPVNHISPESSLRAQELFDFIKKELEEQPTGWWPCRARSFLAELLFLVSQLQEKPSAPSAQTDSTISAAAVSQPDSGYLLCASEKPSTADGETVPRLSSVGGSVSLDFKPVLDFIMHHYNQKITVEELAAVFATNRTTLNERFKSETGKTAKAYLIDLRMRIASAMLIDTALPVAEISERVGMSDVSHFERMFRQVYRMSPKSYRTSAKGARN